MTIDELDQLLQDNPEITCTIANESQNKEPEHDVFIFRNTLLPWYSHKNNHTRVELNAFQSLDTDTLLHQINDGLEVDQYTRITGYFGKVSGWNKGKLGELKDRNRNEGAFRAA